MTLKNVVPFFLYLDFLNNYYIIILEFFIFKHLNKLIMRKIIFVLFIAMFYSCTVYYPNQPQHSGPVVYIVNQYSQCVYTNYYVNWFGYPTGHGYRIFRNYTIYSDGTTVWNDGPPIYF
jgi:hypothetical protein